MYSNCVACGAKIPHESGSIVCRECASRARSVRKQEMPAVYDIVVCVDPTTVDADSAKLIHAIMKQVCPDYSIAVAPIDARYICKDYGRERIL